MAFISINYDDGAPKGKLGYKSVALSYRGVKKAKLFKSGDFVKDWFFMWKFIVEKGIAKSEPIGGSSSIDHFIMDGAPYDSAYLHVKDENDEGELLYTSERPEIKNIKKKKDREKFMQWHVENDKIISGTEIFVPKGTKPTWKEFKEMCKAKKKNVKKSKRT